MTEQRIKIAKTDILKAFEQERTRIFKEADIAAILERNRAFWRLRRGMSVQKFLAFLLEQTALRKVSLDFPNRKMIRYVWGQVPLHEVLMTLGPNCYFSHYTAMYLHGLTEQVPKTIYVNQEQTAKSRGEGAITQDRIDVAMKRPPRVSGNFVQHEDYTIYILNGKNTGNLGVIEMDSSEGRGIRATDVERTLIDVTVRPVYAGGPFEVLKAYKLARPKVSVNKLVATLKKLDYIYPYHQAVGFYLERSGVYKENSVALLRKSDFRFDFYLTHHIKEPAYSQRWRLYFPKGL